jgi:hypothetical protein
MLHSRAAEIVLVARRAVGGTCHKARKKPSEHALLGRTRNVHLTQNYMAATAKHGAWSFKSHMQARRDVNGVHRMP